MGFLDRSKLTMEPARGTSRLITDRFLSLLWPALMLLREWRFSSDSRVVTVQYVQ